MKTGGKHVHMAAPLSVYPHLGRKCSPPVCMQRAQYNVEVYKIIHITLQKCWAIFLCHYFYFACAARGRWCILALYSYFVILAICHSLSLLNKVLYNSVYWFLDKKGRLLFFILSSQTKTKNSAQYDPKYCVIWRDRFLKLHLHKNLIYKCFCFTLRNSTHA